MYQTARTAIRDLCPLELVEYLAFPDLARIYRAHAKKKQQLAAPLPASVQIAKQQPSSSQRPPLVPQKDADSNTTSVATLPNAIDITQQQPADEDFKATPVRSPPVQAPKPRKPRAPNGTGTTKAARKLSTAAVPVVADPASSASAPVMSTTTTTTGPPMGMMPFQAVYFPAGFDFSLPAMPYAMMPQFLPPQLMPVVMPQAPQQAQPPPSASGGDPSPQ